MLQTYVKKENWYLDSKKILIAGSSAISIALILFLVWINIYLISNKTISLGEVITVFLFNTKRTLNNEVQDNLQVAPIQRAIWICLASIVASIALVVSGSLIQSITQNPLADATTLGFINSTIFGIILMKGTLSNIIESYNYHFFYFLFAFIGGLITLLLLSSLFKNPHNKSQNLKIILFGLVLNMIFKTFTYLIKTYNSNAVNPSFALAMGGAENIYGLYNQQFSFLKACSLGLFIIVVAVFLSSQKLNLYELGEEQAKTLGVNVKYFKYFAYTAILLTTTISITLVGNIAFLGLICTHVVRNWLKTRKYQIIIPLGSLLACVLLLLGILLNSLIPFISSSICMLFLGGCMLLSITLKKDF